jgi:hypothetical protein
VKAEAGERGFHSSVVHYKFFPLESVALILIKIPMTFIKEIEKSTVKFFYMETQEAMNSQGNTQIKEQCCRYHNT